MVSQSQESWKRLKGPITLECVELLQLTMAKNKKPSLVNAIADWMCSNDMRVVLSDKEGCLTIFSECQFQKKAFAAVMKNFEVSSLKEARTKKQAIALLSDLGLEWLSTEFSKSKKLHL